MPSSKKRTQVIPPETSESIAEQTAMFLKSGGKIEEIPRGVSGQTSMAAKRHITISRK